MSRGGGLRPLFQPFSTVTRSERHLSVERKAGLQLYKIKCFVYYEIRDGGPSPSALFPLPQQPPSFLPLPLSFLFLSTSFSNKVLNSEGEF